MTSAAEGHFKTEAGRSSTRGIERSSRVTVFWTTVSVYSTLIFFLKYAQASKVFCICEKKCGANSSVCEKQIWNSHFALYFQCFDINVNIMNS